MILIQDGSQNTNVDKPLRIIGDPYKVQVSAPWGLARGSGAERGQAGELEIHMQVERFSRALALKSAQDLFSAELCLLAVCT